MQAGARLAAGVALALCVTAARAQTPVPAEPGKAATDQVVSPTRPPSAVEAPSTPTSTPAGSLAPGGGMSAAEIRELIEAAQATAKATREAVDYSRVTPDLLTQILAKLDKLEDKLDKVENAIKAGAPRRR